LDDLLQEFQKNKMNIEFLLDVHKKLVFFG
jgi:hypothetical protein